MEAVTDAGITQVDGQVAMEMATIAAAEVADQELTPPAPPKKRLLEVDAEVKSRLEYILMSLKNNKNPFCHSD